MTTSKTLYIQKNKGLLHFSFIENTSEGVCVTEFDTTKTNARSERKINSIKSEHPNKVFSSVQDATDYVLSKTGIGVEYTAFPVENTLEALNLMKLYQETVGVFNVSGKQFN